MQADSWHDWCHFINHLPMRWLFQETAVERIPSIGDIHYVGSRVVCCVPCPWSRDAERLHFFSFMRARLYCSLRFSLERATVYMMRPSSSQSNYLLIQGLLVSVFFMLFFKFPWIEHIAWYSLNILKYLHILKQDFDTDQQSQIIPLIPGMIDSSL